MLVDVEKEDVRAKTDRVSVQTEKGDLRTRLNQTVAESAVVIKKKIGLMREVRALSGELTQLAVRVVGERNRVKADQVSLRTELIGLPYEISDVRKDRDVSAAVRKGQRLDHLNRVESAVAKVFCSYRQSLRSVPE